jgi:hypothetical protein
MVEIKQELESDDDDNSEYILPLAPRVSSTDLDYYIDHDINVADYSLNLQNPLGFLQQQGLFTCLQHNDVEDA